LITQLRLVNYKAFRSFSVPFRSTTVIVGPNNAGKSTIIGALRLCAAMLRQASRTAPSMLREDRGEQYRAWIPSVPLSEMEEENLRYELQSNETRLELRVRNGAVLRAVWPPQDSDSLPFFYLTGPGGVRLTIPKQVRSNFPSLGTIPVLTPVDPHESVLTPPRPQES
jgi:predicted ATP-dependent endonuclease of OLD family